MVIGVNALYLIPGGVGGTEIYLRELLAALARSICQTNISFSRISKPAPIWSRSRAIFTGSRKLSARVFGRRGFYGNRSCCPSKPLAIALTFC